MAHVPQAAGSDAGGAPGLLPLSTFVRHASIGNPRLSPDGKHLLVTMTDRGGRGHVLLVYQLSDMSITSKLRMPINQLPLDPMWADNEWIVLEIGKKLGSLDRPVNTGQVIATNLDGTRQTYLFGWKGDAGDQRARRRGADEGMGYIVGRPDVPNGHIYLRAELFGREHMSILYDIDVAKNTRDQLAQMHVSGMRFLVDPDGKAAYAFGTNADFDYVAYRRMAGRWVKLDYRKVGDYFLPFAFTPDHKHVYATINPDGGPTELIKASLDGTRRTVLASNPFASVGDIQWTPEPERPFGASFTAGIPKTVLFDPDAKNAKLFRALSKVFPGQTVSFIDFSQDGGKLLFGVSSDRNPGTYYLIDTKNFKLHKLFSAASWIQPQQMAKRQPFRFKASDGMELEGILTFPLGREHKNLPMILVPHGGPYGVRDSWSFDRDAQFLANRGYLVLQVNFRGSGGRGESFKKAGYRKWGTRIQQDLLDGVRWAIDKHYADPRRICVYGASFGGYSALMTVIRAPKLFQCAIGYAGVYDLAMLFDEGDVQSTDSGESYLGTVLGHDPAKLAANSPDKLADKIQVPVFLVHGKDDERAPYAGAEAMREAMDAAHKPYQWMAVDGEGHGFYTEEHRTEFLTRMQAFLTKYIGPGAPVASK